MRRRECCTYCFGILRNDHGNLCCVTDLHAVSIIKWQFLTMSMYMSLSTLRTVVSPSSSARASMFYAGISEVCVVCRCACLSAADFGFPEFEREGFDVGNFAVVGPWRVRRLIMQANVNLYNALSTKCCSPTATMQAC